MKTTRGAITVVSLDDHSGRLAIQVDGIVTYVGSPEECQRRLNIMRRYSLDPSERDRALGWAIRHLKALSRRYRRALVGPVLKRPFLEPPAGPKCQFSASLRLEA